MIPQTNTNDPNENVNLNSLQSGEFGQSNENVPNNEGFDEDAFNDDEINDEQSELNINADTTLQEEHDDLGNRFGDRDSFVIR